MLDVSYANSQVILTPENIDDNHQIMKCVENIPESYYLDGKWYIKDKHIYMLKERLSEFNGRFNRDKSFVDFINNMKHQNIKKLIIYSDVINSYIVGKDIPNKEIDDATKYFWKPATRNERYKSGKWDGYIHLYRAYAYNGNPAHSFPSGLLYIIENVLNKNNIEYQINYIYDKEPKKQFNWIPNDGFILDQDQIDAVEAGYNGKRGVLKAPTGFGKEVA